jgi:hypothetical protein
MVKEARHYTNKLLEYIEEGLLNKNKVILAFCSYLSEDDIKDFMEREEFLTEEDLSEDV